MSNTVYEYAGYNVNDFFDLILVICDLLLISCNMILVICDLVMVKLT